MLWIHVVLANSQPTTHAYTSLEWHESVCKPQIYNSTATRKTGGNTSLLSGANRWMRSIVQTRPCPEFNHSTMLDGVPLPIWLRDVESPVI